MEFLGRMLNLEHTEPNLHDTFGVPMPTITLQTEFTRNMSNSCQGSLRQYQQGYWHYIYGADALLSGLRDRDHL